MAANRLKGPHLRFGPFHLNAADQLISRDGKPLVLPPKAFDTLVYLAQNCQCLVTRDELIKAVWPKSYVGDGSLSVNISLLRRLLGEMEDGQPYIETVPRKGYRFRPDVVVEPVPQELSHLPPAKEALETRVPNGASVVVNKSRARLWSLVGVILAFSVIGAMFYITAMRHPTAPAFATMLISRLVAPGNLTDAAISPDGKYVAYALDDPEGQSLWIHQITTRSDVRTVATETGDHSSLTFSPDGEYLFYIRTSNDGERILYRRPLLGGDSTRVLSGVSGPISFSPDGKQLAFVRMDPARWNTALIVSNTDGSGLRQVAAPGRPHYLSLRGLAWSPDGRFILCFAGSAPNYDSKAFHLIRVAVVDGSESEVTKHSWAWTGSVMRSAGESVFFVASEQAEDALQIWRASLRDGKCSRVTNDLSNYSTVSVAADGKTLAAVRAANSAEIWVASSHDVDHAVPITSTNIQGLRSLAWTPDGNVIYSARGPEYIDIFRLSRNGLNLRQVTGGSGDKAEAVVTRDRRYVLYQSRGKVWRMDADGRNALQLTFGAHDVHPVTSSDSRWVIYASFADWSPATGGKPTLWKVPIQGGHPIQLTQLATSIPHISPDGGLMACAYFPQGDPRYSQREIAVFKFSAGTSLPDDRPLKIFTRPRSGNDPVYVSPDGKSLDYIVSNRRVGNIWRQPLDGKTPIQLTHFIAGELFDFDWAQDGRELAMARGAAVNDLVLIRVSEPE